MYRRGALVSEDDSELNVHEAPTGRLRDYIPCSEPGSRLPHMNIKPLSNPSSKMRLLKISMVFQNCLHCNEVLEETDEVLEEADGVTELLLNLHCDEVFEETDEVFKETDIVNASVSTLLCDKVLELSDVRRDEILKELEFIRIGQLDQGFEDTDMIAVPNIAIHPEISQLDEDEFFKVKIQAEIQHFRVVKHIKDSAVRKAMTDYVFQLGEEVKMRKDTIYIAVQLVDKLLHKDLVKEKNDESIGCLLIAIILNETEEEIEKFKLYINNKSDVKKIASIVFDVLANLAFDIGWVRATPFTFISYINAKFAKHFQIDEVRKETIATSAENRIVKAARDGSRLMNLRPSAIAAGAILREIDPKLTSEAFKALPLAEVLKEGDLAESYRCLHETDKSTSKRKRIDG